MPCIDGVAHWRDFRPLPQAACDELGLPARGGDEMWIVALRPFIEGTSLADCPEQAARSWAQWSLQLAYSLRGLVAQKCPSSELDADDIVIGKQGRPWIVASPLAPAAGRESAELHKGQDVLQLAELMCWMVSGAAVDTPIDEVPDRLPSEIASLVERTMSQPAELRPKIQNYIDSLQDVVGPSNPPFLSLPPSLYRGLERRVVEAVADGSEPLFLVGDAATGKSFALQRIAARLRLAGQRALLCSTGEPLRSREFGARPGASHSCWDGIRRLIHRLSGDFDPPSLEDVTGDHRFVLSCWTERVQKALPPGETIVLWDDFDAIGPDVRAFFEHFMAEISNHSQKSLRLVATLEEGDDWDGPATRIPVTGPEPKAWDGWRARTRFTEVRQIPVERWRSLVTEVGSRPVALFEAISEAIDAAERPPFAMPRSAARTTPDVSVLFASDWRGHLDRLFASGAYLEVADTSRRLYEVLSRSGREERIDILRMWTEATLRCGANTECRDALHRGLQESAEPTGSGADALLLRARLDWESGHFQNALSVLDQTGELDDAREIEIKRWRAQILVSSGQFETALRLAEAGLQQCHATGDASTNARPHLTSVALGARAMTGDATAIDALKRFIASSEAKKLDPRLRARCHVYRAVGSTRRQEFEDATDAYIRALEEVEGAGFFARLPTRLLDLGTSYRRRGCLGLAHQYYRRGRRLSHEGTSPATRALLQVHEAEIDVVFRRFDRAEPNIEGAHRLVEAHDLQPIKARCARLAGDIACANGEPERALELYGALLAESQIGSDRRARLCFGSAEACLQATRLDRAAYFLDEGRRLIEQDELIELEPHHGILRARLQFAVDDPLAQMTGLERFRRHLLEASEAGDHLLVLKEAPHLFHGLVDDGNTAEAHEIAGVFEKAKQAVATGLNQSLRATLFAQLPALELPLDSRNDAVQKPRNPELTRVEQLRQQRDRLRKEVEDLRRQIADRDEALHKLRKRLAGLEEKQPSISHNASSDNGNSRRGRRPKASRADVVEALQRFNGDYAAVANFLGVSERTVYRYIRRYDIER